MKWNPRQPIITILIATALCLGSGFEDARAGTYGVTQCNATTGAGLSPQWSANLNGSWPAQDLCPSGMQVAGNGIDGVFAQWILQPPSGVTINSVVFGGQGLGTPQVPVYAMLCADGSNPICSWSDYENMSGGPQSHTLNAPGSSSMRFGMGSTCCTHYTSSAYSSIWNLDFTLSESVAPNLGVPSGNLIVNGWNRANVTGGVSASDNESGVQSLLATIDGNPAGPVSVSNNQNCSNTNIVPCPTSTGAWSPTLATSALSDGTHTLRYSATDYAANTSQSANYAFKVDNTRPAVPVNVVTPGTNGWNSANDFDLTWVNTGETVETATQSGISAVKVDVDPTTLGQSDPSPITVPVGTTVAGASATLNSLSNLSVPTQGAWKIKLSVIDKAGNESLVGDGSHGAADSIFNIGFDPNPPAKPQGQNNGWISRDELAAGFVQQWSITTGPSNAPICGYAKSITDAQADPGTAITLPGAVNSFVLPSNLSEGSHWINLRSVTCASIASSATEHIEAPVDLTDPVGQISGVEDDVWYNHAVSIGIRGVDELSGMGASPDQELSHGAYLAYSLDGGSESLAAGGNANVAVGDEGSHNLVFAPVDVAGNKAHSTSIEFGIDDTNPAGRFEITDPSRPTRVAAAVKDSLSGIASSKIDIRDRTGGDWTVLPTSIADTEGNAIAGYPKAATVSARFPDTSLPKGTYDVRLRTYDRAGNELTTSKRTDGSDMTISNPTRVGVQLSAGLSKARRTCHKKKGTKCVKRARGKVVFSNTYPSLAVGFKRSAVVQGFLTSTEYSPLGRQPIEIYAKSRRSGEMLIGTTATRSDGSYVFKIKPGTNRTIRVHYPGTELNEDANASVNLGTAAKLTLHASTKHAHTGQTVSFTGAVQSFNGTVPAAGKIVALQFYAGKKWRPAIAIAHTDSRGRFKVRYKFDGAKVSARIVFRVYAPTEDGWDHTASASRRITMRLN